MTTTTAEFDPAPLNMDRVLSPEWLGVALAKGGKPIDVRGVQVLEKIGTSCTAIRMKLEFGPDVDPSTHAEYCLKGFFGDPSLGYLSSGTQISEASFYLHCAPEISVRVPACHYAGMDPETGAGIIVMSDLVPEGCHFLSALSPYTAAQARGSLDQLARLHGSSWNNVEHWPWTRAKIRGLTQYARVPAGKVTELYQGERGADLPAEMRDGERIYAALRALADRNDAAVQCLIHGDAHAGNVYEGRQGIGLIDWQMLMRGHWSMDVAYHVAAALSVEDRRASEQDLLGYYLERLAAHGGEPPAWDQAWDDYCKSLCYGMFMWAITMRVARPVIKQFCQRLGTAVHDNQSWQRLRV